MLGDIHFSRLGKLSSESSKYRKGKKKKKRREKSLVAKYPLKEDWARTVFSLSKHSFAEA